MVEIIPATETNPEKHFRLHLHPGQKRAWKSKARCVLMLAGSQSGKTCLGPFWLYREIKKCGPGDYLIATPSYKLLGKKLLPEFVWLFEHELQIGTYKASRQVFEFSEAGACRVFHEPTTIPTQVFFGHADNSDTLESMTAKAAWLDECGQKEFRQESYYAIRRRLAIHQGRMLLTTTPYNLGWLFRLVYLPWKTMADQGRRHPHIDIIQFDSLENPAFPPEEYESLRASMPAWQFNLMHRGIFTRPAGMIYDCFDEQVNVCPRFRLPKDWPRHLGLDFGSTNMAGVFLAQEPGSGRLYAYREYKPGVTRSVKEHADALLKGEPMVPTTIGGSASEEGWRDAYRDFGIPCREPDIVGRDSVEVGIARVYAGFKTRQLVIFDDLRMLLDEIGSYSREVDERGQVTNEIEDKSSFHLCDSLRYVVSWLRRTGCGPITPPDECEGNRSVFEDAPAGVFQGDWHKELYGGNDEHAGFGDQGW
jgi:hypothetical protein